MGENMKTLFVLGAGVVCVAGSLAAIRIPSNAYRDALLRADREFNDATAARGLEGFRSFLADNASTLRADKPVLVGKEALADDWKPLLSNPALSMRWAPLSASSSFRGDLGYTLGTYEITKTDEKGKRVVASGKYVTIWRRQADGSYKVEFDSGVPDSPPEQKK
jgi:ketosteroid isomerase-like protein